jgi:ATPase subunit of ABC transporter with duplicated ATPase domains
MLQARELTVEIAERLLVEGATLTVRAGDKVGLVGRNGAGKTTLLGVLAGNSAPSAGVVLRRGALGHLRQDPRGLDEGGGASGLNRVLSGRGLDDATVRMEKLRVAMEEKSSRRNIERFSSAEEAYRLQGGYSAEAEVRRIAAGLGLANDRLDLPAAILSGGERRRLELARILFAGSDVLLLDEPTNHLDTDAKTWLMGWLRAYTGALLVVSHDLALLDEAITRVLHLDDGQLIEYKGTYSQYRAARRKDEERTAGLAKRQEAEVRRLADLADSMRHQSQRRARTAKAIDKRVDRLRSAAVRAPKKRRAISVKFPAPPHSGKVVLAVNGLEKAYGGPPVFRDITFDAERGERLLVMGLNGAGKTSLLRIIAGEAVSDNGSVRFGSGVSLGFYAQEHEGIDGSSSVMANMRASSGASDQALRALIGMFGLTGEIAAQEAGTLSGGEKTKLALAQLVAGRHNLLLLDEPTNNLDPPSRVAVGDALAGWPGTMIVVSHDRDFVANLVPDRVLMMPEGSVDFWNDGLLDLVSLA